MEPREGFSPEQGCPEPQRGQPPREGPPTGWPALHADEVARLGLMERYLRRELSPEEEQAWEAHYFQCESCFAALEELALITRVVREELGRSERAVSPCRERRRWWPFLGRMPRLAVLRPALAFGLILTLGAAALVGWLKVRQLSRQVTDLVAPTAHLVTFALEEGTRSATSPVEIPSSRGHFLLQFTLLQPQTPGSSYVARILDSRARTVWTQADLRPQGPFGVFALLCHGSFFPEGDYLLQVDEVRADNGELLARFTFPFRIQAAVPPWRP